MFDHDRPITTDDDVTCFARDVISAEGGHGRALWILLLDDLHRAVPVLLPVDHLPVDPDPEEVWGVAELIRQLVLGTDAEQAVLIWERPGGGEIRMLEADWAAALLAERAPIRAQLLATDDGIRLLDPVFEAIVAA